jgi:hypothetical protein
MVQRVRVKDQIKSLLAAAVFCLFPAMFFAPAANAQEKPETATAGSKAQHNQQHTSGTQTKHEEEKFPEFEFVAGSDFRSASLVVPLFRGLNIEGHYFGIRSEAEFEEPNEHAAERRSGVVDLGGSTGVIAFVWASTSRSRPGSGSSSAKVKRLHRRLLSAGRSRRAGFFHKGCSSCQCKGPKSSGG